MPALEMQIIELDPDKTCAEQSHKCHNRWHPAIPPVIAVDTGEKFACDTRDALDGQLTRTSTAVDVGRVERRRVHPLTGPVEVRGAVPGDLLEVEILDVSAGAFGYTFVRPGAGFLASDVDAFIARWEIADGFATSRDLPGIRIPGAAFPGTIGVAPSESLVHAARAREGSTATDQAEAVPGTRRIASEGLRTIPPRENGGNVDIRQLTAGTSVLLPVWVAGALLSVGDAHFAQGDGECGGNAIEVCARITMRAHIHRGVARARGIRAPQIRRKQPSAERAGAFHATTGLSGTGGAARSDLTLASRRALEAMIQYLVTERGLTRSQAYALASVTVDLRIGQVVNAGNFTATAFLPLGIFETA